MPLKLYTIDAGGPQDVSFDQLARLLERDETVFWCDITAPDEHDIRLMREVFKFHPLAIEDAANIDFEQRPKLEEYDNHLFLILNTAKLEDTTLIWHEIDVFVGRNYITTVHHEPLPAVGAALNRLKDRPLGKTPTVGHLLYVILDVVVDNYFPLIESVGDLIEEIEDDVLQHSHPKSLRQLMGLKRSMRNLWRILWPEQDITRYLTNSEHAFIDLNGLDYYFRDVHDHLLRAVDLVNTFRDTLTSVMDLYMSSVSNRLNRVVNRLTIITIAIGVLTVVTGFYGMNFAQTWPPFDDPNGVLKAIGIALLAEFALLYYFRRRRIM